MTTAFVKWTSAEGGEQVLALTDEIVVGRSSSSDIVFTQPEVSRRHARLAKNRDGYVIYNLSMSHGNFVNGRPVDGQQQLRSGDRIRLGPTANELHYFVTSEEPSTPSAHNPNDDVV